MSHPICAPEPVNHGYLYLAADRNGIITAANTAARRWLQTGGVGVQDPVRQVLTDLIAPECGIRPLLALDAGTTPQFCPHCRHRLWLEGTPDGLEVHGLPEDGANAADLNRADADSLVQALNAAQQVDEVAHVILTHPVWRALSVQVALFDPVGASLRVLRSGRHGPEVALTVPVQDHHPLAEAFRFGVARARPVDEWITPDTTLNPATREVLTLPLRMPERAIGQLLLTTATTGELARVTQLLPACVDALNRAARFDEASRAQLRYRTLLEISHAALWELDRNFAIQGESPNWEALTGQTYAAYVGHGYLEAVHPEDRPRLEEDIHRGVLSGMPFELRGRMRRADGQYRHVVALALPVPEERGNGQGWAGSIQDVTEDVWAAEWEGPAQQLLTLSVQGGPTWPTFRAVLDELARVSGATGALLVQASGRAGSLRPLATRGPNTQLHALLQHLDPEASGDSLLGLTQPTWLLDLPGGPVPDGNALLVPLRHEERLIALALLDVPDEQLDATGLEHLRWLQGHLAPVVHSAVLRDALERSEAHARSIVSALDEGVVMIDVQGQFVAVNRAARDLLELPHVLPQVFELDWGLLNERGESVPWDHHPAAIAQQTGRAVRQVLLCRERRNGERLWLSINAIPLEDRTGVVISCTDVTEAVTLRQKLTAQAYQDDLTGLGNRRAFRRAVRDLGGPRAAALLIDVDHFKEVNDTYGHHAGDDLLRELALRLRAEVPGGALVARLGGDEFGITHPELEPGAATDLARRIVAAINRPIQLGSVQVQVSASVGVALAGCAPDGDLHRAADLAMYAVKRAGKSGWQAFSHDLPTALPES